MLLLKSFLPPRFGILPRNIHFTISLCSSERFAAPSFAQQQDWYWISETLAFNRQMNDDVSCCCQSLEPGNINARTAADDPWTGIYTITIKCFFKRGKYSVIILAEVARGFEVLSFQIWAKKLGTQRVFGTFCTPPTTFFGQLPESWTNFCPNWTTVDQQPRNVLGESLEHGRCIIFIGDWSSLRETYFLRLAFVWVAWMIGVGLVFLAHFFYVTHPQQFSSQVPKYVNWSLAPVFNRPVKMLNDHLLPKYPLVTAKTCLNLLS